VITPIRSLLKKRATGYFLCFFSLLIKLTGRNIGSRHDRRRSVESHLTDTCVNRNAIIFFLTTARNSSVGTIGVCRWNKSEIGPDRGASFFSRRSARPLNSRFSLIGGERHCRLIVSSWIAGNACNHRGVNFSRHTGETRTNEAMNFRRTRPCYSYCCYTRLARPYGIPYRCNEASKSHRGSSSSRASKYLPRKKKTCVSLLIESRVRL